MKNLKKKKLLVLVVTNKVHENRLHAHAQLFL